MWGRDRGGRKQEEKRIQTLEQAVEGLQRDSKVIRLEWEDVYDRVTRTMGRLNARIRKSEALTGSEGDIEGSTLPPASPPVEVLPTGTHGLLTQMRARRRK